MAKSVDQMKLESFFASFAVALDIIEKVLITLKLAHE